MLAGAIDILLSLLSNLVRLPLLFVSGIFIPIQQMPIRAHWIAPLSPLSHAIDSTATCCAMYILIYIYPVTPAHVVEFLAILKAAASIYMELGTAGVDILEDIDLRPAYGCQSLGSCLGRRSEERVFISIDRFRDRSHRDEVMEKVDADERIEDLYNRMCDLIDITRVFRGEFEGNTV
jgi:uncharacterized protein YbaA (DUF1428 family)